MSHVLAASGSIEIASGAYTGKATVGWSNFPGLESLSDFFEFFRPLSYKLDILNLDAGDSVSLVTSPDVVASVYPINYVVQSSPSLTFDVGDLATMSGHVSYQPGGNNRGKWSRWPNS